MPIDTYVAKLDAQLAPCRDWSDVERHLPSPEPDEVEWATAVENAFSFWFQFPDDPYVPGSYPDLGEPTDGIVEGWRAVLDRSVEPVVQARLADLLWQLKAKPRPDQRAAQASIAYEQLAQRWGGLDAKNALIRALQLTMAVGADRTRAAALIATAMDRFDASIENGFPGVSFGYLDVLVYAPPDLRPADLDARFERAKAAYAAQPHHLQQIIDLQKHLAGNNLGQRAALDQEAIHVYLAAAEHSVGLASYLHLQSAVAAAHNYPDLRDVAMTRQRAFDRSSLDLHLIAVTQEIDPNVLRRHRAYFVDQANWQTSMEKLLELPPPSGDAQRNREQARELLEQHVLRLATTQHRLDANSGHARTLDANDEVEMQVGEIEVGKVRFEAAVLIVPVLTLLPVRHHIDRSELKAWLHERYSGPECNLVEESLWRWWNGDDDTVCALLLIPAIESLVRLQAEQRGVTVTMPAVGHRRAGFKSLGELLAALSDRIDESWRRYLLCVLVSEFGLNLRNNLCHGIALSASFYDFAVLLVAALRLMRMPATAASLAPMMDSPASTTQ